MKIITCASYHGSGSSAITDFVSEFSNVFSFTEEEFRFVHDPEGISDLEYHLVDNFNRLNSGHALKRYLRLVDRYWGNPFIKRYDKFFQGNWKRFSHEYVEELTDFSYHGWWHYDLLDRGLFFYFRKRILSKLLHLTFWRDKRDHELNLLKNEITYCSHPSEEMFLCCTRRYIERLFSSVSDNKEIVMVDQLVASTNIAHYIRYFNDIKVVLVDRDPRDLFVLEKYVWNDGVIPTDVKIFCKWFKYTRSHRKTENVDTDQIIFIRFEDMIYHYDETKEKLIQRLGLDPEKHTRQRERFNPAKSIKNTQVWKEVKCDPVEIEYIEHELAEYLYPFDEILSPVSALHKA